MMAIPFHAAPRVYPQHAPRLAPTAPRPRLLAGRFRAERQPCGSRWPERRHRSAPRACAGRLACSGYTNEQGAPSVTPVGCHGSARRGEGGLGALTGYLSIIPDGRCSLVLRVEPHSAAQLAVCLRWRTCRTLMLYFVKQYLWLPGAGGRVRRSGCIKWPAHRMHHASPWRHERSLARGPGMRARNDGQERHETTRRSPFL